MIQGEVAQLLQAIARLNEIGISLSRERDEEQVLERILAGAMDLTGADGGTIYSVIDGDRLRFRIMRTDSLGIHLGGNSGKRVDLPEVPLHAADGSPNHSSVVAHAVIEQTTVVIADAYAVDQFDFSGTRAFDQRTGYRSRAMLTVPMRDHHQRTIGVLQLLNPNGPAAAEPAAELANSFTPSQVQLVESLASQASIILTNGQLVREVSELFESFVKLIARAIDEKSPYTGSHCRRVPELTMRLAEAASAQTSGPLADFQMDADGRYQLLIASWLHDCGKITTPEWVMDKASKLQRIHDRIDEVATRIAVIQRQAEVNYWRVLAEGPAESPAVKTAAADLSAIQSALSDDLAFLRRVNVGSEAMAEADQQRVRRIAAHTWVDAHGTTRQLLDDDEVENLCIAHGTLLPRERKIINHHIVATIEMLNRLPFPEHLARVPEIAGGHHERMDGKGYPNGLTRDQMSVEARCMGISDIFEALTAADRPYKKAMTISQALTILGRLKENHHIDPDLFDIFIRQRIWESYAQEFLQPNQCDSVDLSTIPGYQP